VLEPLSSRRLSSVDTPTFSTERRHSQRLKVRCDAELTASLSILDGDANVPAQSLIFFGETRDLNAQGVGLVLPSISIDKNFCRESDRVKISLHLPEGSVALEAEPVRCVPLNPEDIGQGSLLGARIVSISDNDGNLERYLKTLPRAAL
jgi:hypothetical protein